MGKASAKKSNVTYIDPKEVNLLPKNERQDRMIHGMKTKQLVVAAGSAGTGKTYCAVVMACQLYKAKRVRKIVLTRPNLGTGPSLGAFPGEAEDKLALWLKEMLDIIKETLGTGDYEYMLSKGRIVLEPMETCRGRSYNDAFIIVDESQNMTTSQLKMMATRIGEGSTMVFCGDSSQADYLKGEGEPGLQFIRFFNMLEQGGVDMCSVVFRPEDIVRSGIVKDIVLVCEANGI